MFLGAMGYSKSTLRISGGYFQTNPIHRNYISSISQSICLRNNQISSKLTSGQNNIFTPNIGILPIYSPAVISTRGLEWDITDWATQMGGMVSTSNHIMGDKVEVETDVVVLFTIEIAQVGDGG
jgi:thiamine pyrophosphokinase